MSLVLKNKSLKKVKHRKDYDVDILRRKHAASLHITQVNQKTHPFERDFMMYLIKGTNKMVKQISNILKAAQNICHLRFDCLTVSFASFLKQQTFDDGMLFDIFQVQLKLYVTL